MGNTNAVAAPEIKALIRDTVEATLLRIRGESKKDEEINYFAAMEKILYAYPALKALMADKQAYINVEYHSKSKDIVRTQGGGTYKGTDDLVDDLMEQRRCSFRRTQEHFEEVARVIRQFEQLKKFNVIRMYYFNEDAQGRQRDAEAPRMTWEDVAWELSELGIVIDEKTARRWKNEMVRKMMVIMFGPDAAAYAAMIKK